MKIKPHRNSFLYIYVHNQRMDSCLLDVLYLNSFKVSNSNTTRKIKVQEYCTQNISSTIIKQNYIPFMILEKIFVYLNKAQTTSVTYSFTITNVMDASLVQIVFD